MNDTNNEPDIARAQDVAARVLARQNERKSTTYTFSEPSAEGESARPTAHRAPSLQSTSGRYESDAGSLEREARAGLRRVASLSTELEDVSEVEYRQVRLERVVLVGVYQSDAVEAENSLHELAALAQTAGSQVLDGVMQRRDTPDPATYLGSGKARELAQIVADCGADTVIVDTELAPSQRRGLEDVVRVKVVDRTALILDIFAQHAQSREGKAQVELAQLEYLLPRLRGWGESMSRQAGGRVAGGEGIGSRGPGETKIELDRRRIRRRMAKLKREIAHMKPAREQQRASRRKGAIPSVAIAGYTNAGKSTLLNRLTGASVMVEDALFATLDPTVRQTETPDGRAYTVSDTVGFVRNLPTQLVEAFRSTLEEVGDADLIVHVVDAAHPDPLGQIQAVHNVFDTIEGARQIPEIIVFNKYDIAPVEEVAYLRSQVPDSVAVSARTGAGFDELRQLIALRLPRPAHAVDVIVPYEYGELVHRFHTDGEIDTQEYLPSGTRLVGRVDPGLAHDLAQVDVSDEQ